jgi:hypothetical protein
MTEDEAFELYMDRDEPLARAMFQFRTEMARHEQAQAQRKPPSSRAVILMHYEAVKAIVQAAGFNFLNDPLHMHGGKWWFWDETWADRHGPYPSRPVAKAALIAYCKELNGDT